MSEMNGEAYWQKKFAAAVQQDAQLCTAPVFNTNITMPPSHLFQQFGPSYPQQQQQRIIAAEIERDCYAAENFHLRSNIDKLKKIEEAAQAEIANLKSQVDALEKEQTASMPVAPLTPGLASAIDPDAHRWCQCGVFLKDYEFQCTTCERDEMADIRETSRGIALNLANARFERMERFELTYGRAPRGVTARR